MRILFFLESLQTGGKERRAAELMSYLKEKGGYEIGLVLTEEEIHYDYVRTAVSQITILKRKGLKYDPGIIFRFYKVCRDFNPDIIHSWGKMATFYSIPAKIICRIPLVANLIADTIKGYGRLSKYAILLKINIFFSDRVLANSRAGLIKYGLNSAKSRVIYNGVRLSRFTEQFDTLAVRKEFRIRSEYAVVMVATFSEYKDYDLFVNTAKVISAKRDDITFIAVGEGPEFERIKLRIADEHVENIVLAGRHKNVEKIVSAADIGLLCTKSEGISNSIIEYMALGKPVIASDITGGSRELINEGITGYCTPRDPVLISELIIRLVDDRELRLSMGAKGKKRIEQDFSVSRMGEAYVSLYDEISTSSRRIDLVIEKKLYEKNIAGQPFSANHRRSKR
jgi:glycosyltransferase involved in cell wall biosynthesis